MLTIIFIICFIIKIKDVFDVKSHSQLVIDWAADNWIPQTPDPLSTPTLTYPASPHLVVQEFLTINNSVYFQHVSNSEDSVIEGGSASSTGDDSTGVLMEDILIGFDGNRDWSNVKGGFQSIDGAFWNVSVCGGSDFSLGLVVLAGEESGLGIL
jgi:hypothetical protein